MRCIFVKIGEVLGNFVENLLDSIIGKIIIVFMFPFIPIIALLGIFHVTGNYLWDLLIGFAIPLVIGFLIWLLY